MCGHAGRKECRVDDMERRGTLANLTKLPQKLPEGRNQNAEINKLIVYVIEGTVATCKGMLLLIKSLPGSKGDRVIVRRCKVSSERLNRLTRRWVEMECPDRSYRQLLSVCRSERKSWCDKLSYSLITLVSLCCQLQKATFHCDLYPEC